MVDVLSAEQRQLNMSRIRGRDTKPEMLLRRGLHSRGLRFRLHVRNMPGCPDLVFPSRRVAVFMHGCFWHVHDCSNFKLPSTRTDFWTQKLLCNVDRDRQSKGQLLALGWRVLIVWECAFRGKNKDNVEEAIGRAEKFILAIAGPCSEEIPHGGNAAIGRLRR